MTTPFRKKEYRESMYNYINDRAREVERDVRKLYDGIKAEDIIDARGGGPKYKSLFKQAIPDVQRGTEKAIENFLLCFKKGCYFDPLPCREMSYPAKEYDPSRDRGAAESGSNRNEEQTLSKTITCEVQKPR
jgi:hypothetical protein